MHSIKDFYEIEGLRQIHDKWMEQLPNNLKAAEHNSELIIQLAPILEEFICNLFDIPHCLDNKAQDLQIVAKAARVFVQRIAMKTCQPALLTSEEFAMLEKEIREILGTPQFDSIAFARLALSSEDDRIREKLIYFAAYAALWQIYPDEYLFHIPQKTDYSNLLKEPISKTRDGFTLTEPPISLEYAAHHANYCINCHQQSKDSCSTGMVSGKKNPLGVDLSGCPLEEKISEMNLLKAAGFKIAPLAVAVIDNPMIAATGHRICNDCSRACIYQKQEPVDIPAIESRVLADVLSMPFGFEIYALLTKWNPLNFANPLPIGNSGYKILVAGMGPAGFTLSHYLLNNGHEVVGIDGLKIEPLPQELTDIDKIKPIRDIHEFFTSLDQRMPQGFGGVAEYGITVRWDKNLLLVIRLLLQRGRKFTLLGNTRLGSNITRTIAFDELGFDHIALCMGAGSPKIIEMKNNFANGVRTASDFLMTLQLNAPYLPASVANLEVRMPIVVIGGGLTSLDAATEALAYYPLQVEKFLRRFEMSGKLLEEIWHDVHERKIASQFISHAETLRDMSNRHEVKKLLDELGGASLVYRGKITDSPAYRLNHHELQHAINEGVKIIDQSTPIEIISDESGRAIAILLKDSNGDLTRLPAGTILLAAGTRPNEIIMSEDPDLVNKSGDFIYGKNITHFGDMNPKYAGSVVKAMASAKHGYQQINQLLLQKPPRNIAIDIAGQCNANVVSLNFLTPKILEILLKAPSAARQFRPGQFYRLQRFGDRQIEPLAMTGAWVDGDLIALIVLLVGDSSNQCRDLLDGEVVSLMGPTGTPTEIPYNKNILLIGGGLGNAVLFSIGKAMRANGCCVTYIAGYRSCDDIFKREEIEMAADCVIWVAEDKAPPFSRDVDSSMQGNVLDALKICDLDKIDEAVVIGSCAMMAAVAKALRGKKVTCSINSPMQCMMKEICGSCLQLHHDTITGDESFIYSCRQQDQDGAVVDFEFLKMRLMQNQVSERFVMPFLDS